MKKWGYVMTIYYYEPAGSSKQKAREVVLM